MIFTIIVSCLTFLGITLSILFFPHVQIKKVRIDTYWIIALLGALLLIVFNAVPFKDVINGINNKSNINPIKILVLFFSMTVMSIYLDEVGLFRYLAVLATKRAGKNQFVLFFILYGLTSLLTVFTSNDVVILTLTPFICFFCKNAKINPFPYLIAEFAAANTWSMMLIIGNPTNIYLATSAEIDFVEYLKVMWLPTLYTGIFQLGLIYLIFHKRLSEKMDVQIDDFKIESKIDLIIGLTALVTCLIFLILSDYLNFAMWLISLSCASALLLIVIAIRLITKKNWSYLTKSLKRLPYQLIPFVLSMFVIVITLNYQGISEKIGHTLSRFNVTWSYGVGAFFSSNLINNIPTSILFSNLTTAVNPSDYTSAIYASIVGTNIGAFFTPIGALAGIMFASLVHSHDIKFSFLDFTVYGLIIAVPSLAVALATLIFF